MEMRSAKDSGDLRRWVEIAYDEYIEELVPFGAEFVRDRQGLWRPDLLPYWFEREECLPLVAIAGGVPAGFAFVGTDAFEHRHHDSDYCLSEFFVPRQHRREGLGRAFAAALFAEMSGRWELSVLRRNDPALRFWRSILGSVEEHQSAQEIDFVFQSGDATKRS